MNEIEENKWAMACHLAALAGLVIPLGNIMGPLIVWILKREESDKVNVHGVRALNFQITFTIAMFVAGLTMFILIGFLLMPIIGIAGLIFTILAAIKTSQGEDYQYPFSLELLK